MKQISLFNHKGGVSKTTTAFNLGWMLANKGKRVLLADCDPQCNLTGMFLGFKGSDELEKMYRQGGVKNIRDGLAPAFESKPVQLSPVDCVSMNEQDNLLLMPGHIGLAEYETTLGIAQELSGSLVTLQNLPGAISHLFEITAAKNQVDYVLVDMSPSLGPINQNLLSTSHYFIVPMAPDFFSVMATDSLASILPKWHEWAKKARGTRVLAEAAYPFPNRSPKFLGTIIQKYRLRANNEPATAFQRWIDEVNEKVRNRLVPVLRENEMLLEPSAYKAAGLEPGDAIIQISEFNSLIAQSQKHSAPVFNLTDAQLEQTGIVLERTKKSMKKFREAFETAADRVISMTS